MKKISFLIRDDRGAIALTTAVLLAAFVGVLALVIDLGHLHTVQNELQNAADSSALAGARAIYPMESAPPWELSGEYAFPQFNTKILPAAQGAALANQADFHNISVKVEEVEPGWWNYANRTFTKSACTSYEDTNAVRVTTRMAGDLSQGSVIMSFARIFGFNSVDVQAKAIAAVGYLDTLPKDSKGGFIGANDDFLNRLYQQYPPPNGDMKFYLIIGSAGGQLNWEFADNAGWTAPVGTNPTPNFLKDVIANGTPIDLVVGSTDMTLTNGEKTPALVAIDAAINADGPMKITIPTFHTDMWNQTETIKGFYDVNLTDAWKPGDKPPDSVLENLRPILDDNGKVKQSVGIIEFELVGYTALGGGGGNVPSNTFATYPKLVENDSRLKNSN